MAEITNFIRSNLLDPLKQYPTVVQDTLIELITQKLNSLYDYTVKFPSIIAPDQSRMDILKAIADQFLFTIREDADIQEQIDILDKILYVYRKRGSIDTIENMWKYYGGNLPKDVKITIPSYNLYRYSVSSYSGKNVYQDSRINRTGTYEVRVSNNKYPIPELKDFMLKELVAAGNYIYFLNAIHADIFQDEKNPNDPKSYNYIIKKHTTIHKQMSALRSLSRLTWSGYSPLSASNKESTWSGKLITYTEITRMLELDRVLVNKYLPDGFIVSLIPLPPSEVKFTYITSRSTYLLEYSSFLYCTPKENSYWIARHLYNNQGNLIESEFPGYFVLGRSLLGREVI